MSADLWTCSYECCGSAVLSRSALSLCLLRRLLPDRFVFLSFCRKRRVRLRSGCFSNDYFQPLWPAGKVENIYSRLPDGTGLAADVLARRRGRVALPSAVPQSGTTGFRAFCVFVFVWWKVATSVIRNRSSAVWWFARGCRWVLRGRTGTRGPDRGRFLSMRRVDATAVGLGGWRGGLGWLLRKILRPRPFLDAALGVF